MLCCQRGIVAVSWWSRPHVGWCRRSLQVRALFGRRLCSCLHWMLCPTPMRKYMLAPLPRTYQHAEVLPTPCGIATGMLDSIQQVFCGCCLVVATLFFLKGCACPGPRIVGQHPCTEFCSVMLPIPIAEDLVSGVYVTTLWCVQLLG